MFGVRLIHECGLYTSLYGIWLVCEIIGFSLSWRTYNFVTDYFDLSHITTNQQRFILSSLKIFNSTPSRLGIVIVLVGYQISLNDQLQLIYRDVMLEAFIFVCILQESSCLVFCKPNIVICTLPTHPVSGREVFCRVILLFRSFSSYSFLSLNLSLCQTESKCDCSLSSWVDYFIRRISGR